MNFIGNTGITLVSTFGGIYLLMMLLRFLLQTARADFYNPVSQSIVRFTDPLVKPLRMIIPGYRGIDFATLFAALLEARGTDWFRERYPEVFASKHWARGEEVVAVFGWPGVAGLSAMPFPLHPLVVLGVLAGMKKRALLSALFLGRFTKYLAFGWVATNSPGALRRLRGGGEKRT